MAKITTKVDKRKVTGRKVKQLRRDGILPANIYGKKVKSLAVQLVTKDFNKLYSTAGETNIVYVTVDSEKTDRPCLISHIQYNPVTDAPLHADFHQVDLTQKVTAEIPVELVGEAEIAKSGEGTVVLQNNTLEVEALPTDLPDKFEVDVTTLKAIGDSIKLSDLKYNKDKVTIELDPETVIVTTQALAEEEELPVAPEETAEGEEGEEVKEGEEKKEGEDKPAEGETKEGEKKEEGKKEEPKPENKKE